MKSIGHMTMSKDQRFSDAVHDMTFETKSDLSTSLDEIVDDELTDVSNETENSPMVQKAPKGKDLQQKRNENVSLSFDSDSLIVMHEFLFKKYLQSESLVILNSEEKMHLDEADMIVDDRLIEKNCVLSPSQEKTPAEGNCFIWAIIDQCGKDSIWKNHYSSKTYEMVTKIRKLVNSTLTRALSNNILDWNNVDPENIQTPDQWKQKMSK